MLKAFRLCAMALVGAALLAGCGSLNVNPDSMGAKIIIQGVTMKYIEREYGKEARAGRAVRITRAANDARVLLDMQGVTVADLKAKMLERIAKADLEASDKMLLTALVDAVNIELTDRIGDGVVSPDGRTTVNAVLSWVKQAASFYG